MYELKPNTPVYAFDDDWISHQSRIVRRWLPAELSRHPVITADQCWEPPTLTLFGSVFPDPQGGYNMYYTGWAPGERTSVMLAHSDNGTSWTKPSLGVIEDRGNSNNNIVLRPEGHWDSPTIIHDPEDNDSYKLLMFHAESLATMWTPDWGLYGFTSPDGLHWNPMAANGPLLRCGDRSNLMAKRSAGKYVLYSRHPLMFEHTGARAVYRSESQDFKNWSELEPAISPDLRDEPGIEYYGMSVFERHGWFFGLLEYWDSDIDCIDVHLALSRDGKQWFQPEPRQPFIAAGTDWNRSWTTVTNNEPLIVDEQMLFYVGGRHFAHDFGTARHHGAIGYASLPIDRFCALEGQPGYRPYAGIEGVSSRVTSAALHWPGGELVLNADTRRSYASHPMRCDGRITVDLLDEQGLPLPGWSEKDAGTFSGNTHCRGAIGDGRVRWSDAKAMDNLRGKKVKLRFTLDDARLFTFEAEDKQMNKS